MTRRPPAGGLAANRLLLTAVLFILLPWLADAQQQQNQQPGSRQIRGLKSHQVDEQREYIPHVEATTLPGKAQHVKIDEYGRDALNAGLDDSGGEGSDVITTKVVAPADLAVRAPSTGRSSIFNGAGLTLQSARNLGDAEIEDFVLMATVDGRVFARDRKSGREKWVLDIEQPIIKVEYPERNISTEGNSDPPIYDLWWVVEPNADGPIYLYVSAGIQSGLVDMGLSMKKLVDMSPHIEGRYMYIGQKKSEVYTVDAENGNVVQWHGSEGSFSNSCGPRDEIRNPDDENCQSRKIFDIIRNEYTVNIRERNGRDVAKLKYAEWAPSNHNKEYVRQNQGSLDGKFWYSRHDGTVYAFEPQRNNAHERPTLYNTKLASPVVRVFDVVRPLAEEKDVPNLIVLSQPPPEPWGELEDDIDRRHSRVFVNQTEIGDLYAMSGRRYPLAIDGPKYARCNHRDYLETISLQQPLSKEQFQLSLVGLHSIDGEQSKPLLTIDGVLNNTTTASNSSVNQTLQASPAQPSLYDHALQLPEVTKAYAVSFLLNPFTVLSMVIAFLYYRRRLGRILRNRIGFNGIQHLESHKVDAVESSTVEHKAEDASTDAVADITDVDAKPALASVPTISEDTSINTGSGITEESNEAKEPKDELGTEPKPMVQASNEVVAQEKAADEKPKTPTDEANGRTKKQRRGKRGGARNRKTTPKEDDVEDAKKEDVENPTSPAEEPNPSSEGPETLAEPTVDEAVRDAQRYGPRKTLEPDVQSVMNDVNEVSGPILRLGNLLVNQDKLIGTGSNGTMVFEGRLGGRVVAVKRMLRQFYDIATHETRLLEESDIHPNVIRYFIQQESQGFLYIALELCSAALSDVIERPLNHRELAESGERHLPNILYQITNGLRHLHRLRIVHRDLKPHNILVKMGENGIPRMVVSDFGLCKKLEGEQSSFGATTANAAGTPGWRAPEVLLEDDLRQMKTVQDTSSITSDASGPLIATDALPTRRATRAIDIFSLGLVFFYVLCRGAHPFDCNGGRYMREVNIRKNLFTLDALDALGDDRFEARDLIASMINQAPKERPSADEVMAHPFFWSKERKLEFLCDVSDYFEKEKREPPTAPLLALEEYAECITHGDFLKPLGREFLDTLGKQRKYTGSRLLDLLRALRNKKNHYEDMPESLKLHIGPLPDGYLSFWTTKFPNLLISCWVLVKQLHWQNTPRFTKYYYQPPH